MSRPVDEKQLLLHQVSSRDQPPSPQASVDTPKRSVAFNTGWATRAEAYKQQNKMRLKTSIPLVTNAMVMVASSSAVPPPDGDSDPPFVTTVDDGSYVFQEPIARPVDPPELVKIIPPLGTVFTGTRPVINPVLVGPDAPVFIDTTNVADRLRRKSLHLRLVQMRNTLVDVDTFRYVDGALGAFELSFVGDFRFKSAIQFCAQSYLVSLSNRKTISLFVKVPRVMTANGLTLTLMGFGVMTQNTRVISVQMEITCMVRGHEEVTFATFCGIDVSGYAPVDQGAEFVTLDVTFESEATRTDSAAYVEGYYLSKPFSSAIREPKPQRHRWPDKLPPPTFPGLHYFHLVPSQQTVWGFTDKMLNDYSVPITANFDLSILEEAVGDAFSMGYGNTFNACRDELAKHLGTNRAFVKFESIFGFARYFDTELARGTFDFVDLCAGPGYFSVFLLARTTGTGTGLTLLDTKIANNDWLQTLLFNERFHSIVEFKGDILAPQVVDGFYPRMLQRKVRLVAADGSVTGATDPQQELNNSKLIAAEVLVAAQSLLKGGTFVLKMFGIHLPTSFCIMAAICDAFETVYIVKPVASRPFNSEFYVAAFGFNTVGMQHFVNLRSILDGCELNELTSLAQAELMLVSKYIDDFKVTNLKLLMAAMRLKTGVEF